jgi:hypothetical protein
MRTRLLDVDEIGLIPVRLFAMASIFGEFGPKVKVDKGGRRQPRITRMARMKKENGENRTDNKLWAGRMNLLVFFSAACNVSRNITFLFRFSNSRPQRT